MEDKIKMDQRIDDYILGRMSDEEVRRFEEDLRSDEELLREYESRKLISSSVSLNHLKALAAKAEEEYQVSLTDEIDRYIRNSMTPEERISFEHRMEESPEVRRRYEEQALIVTAVSRNHLRELATAAEARYQEKKTPFFKRVFGDIEIQLVSRRKETGTARGTVAFRRVAYSLAVAASLAVVAIGGFSYQQHSAAPDVGSQLMSSLPQTMVAMGPEDDVASLIDTAQEQMERKEFAAAEASLNEAIRLAGEYVSDIMCRDDSERYAQKIEVLEMYSDDAQWCKAVNYLNQGKAGKAKKLLKSIVAGNGFHADEAAKALNELRIFR